MDLDKAEADIIVGELLWTRRPHMRVASCSSYSICLRTRWIYLTPLGTVAGFGSVPPWRRGRVRAVLIGGGGRGAPGGARRGQSRRSAGDAAPLPLHAGCWSRPAAAATSRAAFLEKIAGENGRGKSSLRCAKEEDARQGGYADGESADLCARWPIFSRVLKD